MNDCASRRRPRPMRSSDRVSLPSSGTTSVAAWKPAHPFGQIGQAAAFRRRQQHIRRHHLHVSANPAQSLGARFRRGVTERRRTDARDRLDDLDVEEVRSVRDEEFRALASKSNTGWATAMAHRPAT